VLAAIVDFRRVEDAVPAVEIAVRPQVSELGSSCVSYRPNPVTTTSRVSALPSPSVSLRNRMSGAFATQTPRPDGDPRGDIQPVGEDREPVGLAVAVGILQDLDPVTPEPADWRGYSTLSVIQTRPRSSKVMATGLTMSGSLATSSTLNPGGTVIRAIAWSGVRAGPGGRSWAWGIGSLRCPKAGERIEKNEANISASADRPVIVEAPGRGGVVGESTTRSVEYSARQPKRKPESWGRENPTQPPCRPFETNPIRRNSL